MNILMDHVYEVFIEIFECVSAFQMEWKKKNHKKFATFVIKRTWRQIKDAEENLSGKCCLIKRVSACQSSVDLFLLIFSSSSFSISWDIKIFLRKKIIERWSKLINWNSFASARPYACVLVSGHFFPHFKMNLLLDQKLYYKEGAWSFFQHNL